MKSSMAEHLPEYLAFFGAFNPPTNAHIELAHEAMTLSDSEGVIFVPSKMTYIADFQKKSFAFNDEARLDMLARIAADHPWMHVTDHEVRQKEQPRSYFTLKYLQEKGYHCALLFGSDKLKELQTGWLHVEEIAHEFGMVCMARENDNCEELIEQDTYLSQLKPYIRIIHTNSIYREYSSSKVREAFIDGKLDEVKQMIPSELDLNQYKNKIL